MLPASVSKLLRRPVIWILIFGVLIGYAAYALIHIPVEVLPRFNYPQISVIAHYPGATPEEIETVVARPVEGQLLGIPGLVGLRSVMGQGTLQITARFGSGTDAQRDLQTVYSAIDRARTSLPPDVQPYAEIMGNAINEVADYSVRIPTGTAPVAVQRAIQTRVLPALRALPGVQRVEVFGTGDESLWIQPDLQALHHYGISLATLANALRKQVMLGPAGYMTLGHQDILIEARHLPKQPADLTQILVPAHDGEIRLGDLAKIIRAPMPVRYAVDLDGQPTVAVIVVKQATASTVPVTKAVAQTLRSLQDQLPAGATWVRVYSQGHLVRLIGSDLGRNLLVGGALAVGILFWILGFNRGVWILAVSIPLALLMGMAALYASGQTLNLLTLGALTVAVGLLADDGIIVLESIYHRWEHGDSGVTGVWRGLKDIAAPDITGTLSTVSVYLPLLFVGGLAGLFFVPFALAMGLALVASLLVSLTLIPFVLTYVRSRPPRQTHSGMQFVASLGRHNDRLLDFTLGHPYVSLSISAALLLLSIGLVFRVPADFLPLPNEGVLLDGFTLPPGSSLQETRDAVHSITRRLRADPSVAHTFARIGSAGDTAYTERNFAGEIQVVLKPGVSVTGLDSMAERFMQQGHLGGVQQSYDTPTIERMGESLSGLPQPFVITVYGNRIDTLRQASTAIVKRMKRVHGLSDIFNNDAYPVTQLQIDPRPEAMALYGITPDTLYRQLQPALAGTVLAKLPEGSYHIDLYMRLANAPTLGLHTLEQLLIRTQKGWTPLATLAHVRMVTGPNQIRHIDGARAVDILATPTGFPGSTIAAAKKALTAVHLPDGYRASFGGLYPRLEHAAIALAVAALGAFLLMLGILVVQFEGMLVPAILFLEIPLAFTGGALLLGLSGIGLNATGLIGFLTVIGISLNHGIVLLHRARRQEAEGMSPSEAIREAVHVRFRPILLTTLTAVLGMLPTALGWGLGAEPEQGLAVVVLGGVLWSSLLSTNLIPALYLHWHRRGLPSRVYRSSAR